MWSGYGDKLIEEWEYKHMEFNLKKINSGEKPTEYAIC